jgi:hypothetical protein
MIQGLVTIAFCLFLFLVLREVMLWYWKVNNVIQNQEKIIKLLEEQQAYRLDRSKAEDKHHNYMENNLFAIKSVLTKPDSL